MRGIPGIIASAIIFLSACGDSDNGASSSDNEKTSLQIDNSYATEDDLPRYQRLLLDSQ